jgi:hypothetical protein
MLPKQFSVRVVTCALFLSWVAACSVEEPVSKSEKALFVRAADLAPFGVHFPNAEDYERFSKQKHFGGSYELTYEFRTPEDAKERPLFIHVGVSVLRTGYDAVLSEQAGNVGLLVGLKSSGAEEREVADYSRDGEAGKLALLVLNGKPIGNSFRARAGTKTYLLVMSGIYFDDPEDWRKVIAPKLKLLASYTPE